MEVGVLSSSYQKYRAYYSDIIRDPHRFIFFRDSSFFTVHIICRASMEQFGMEGISAQVTAHLIPCLQQLFELLTI